MSSPRGQSPKAKASRELSPSANDNMKKNNSSNKSNAGIHSAKSASPEATFDEAMVIDSNEDAKEDNMGPLQKLQATELLPELYNLLIDLQNGHILAKDFDNNAGSIRLKIANIKQNLQEISGIDESVKFREAKIEGLKYSIEKKSQFLNNFKQKVEFELNKD